MYLAGLYRKPVIGHASCKLEHHTRTGCPYTWMISKYCVCVCSKNDAGVESVCVCVYKYLDIKKDFSRYTHFVVDEERKKSFPVEIMSKF